MAEQTMHGMMPRASHDERSRQDYVVSLKSHIAREITPGNHAELTARVLPAARRAGRTPRTRPQLRAAMERAPFHQMWGSLMRTGQELMWDSVADTVDRQLGALAARARRRGRTKGSLTLDPDFVAPRYVRAVDVHTMPGGTCDDAGPGDVRAGALYDRGAFMYHHGNRGEDDNGRLIVAFVRTHAPDLRPARILDLGCTVGHATLALADFFPAAEVHAVDVGRAVLRYAHARAEAMGRAVHFKLASAEATGYPDDHFDLVVSSNLLHETSRAAVPRIFAECRRVLRPGGVMCHMEVPVRYRDMALYDQVMRGWQTLYNAEPFWDAVCALDLVALARAAGLREVADGYLERTRDPDRDRRTWAAAPDQGANYRYMLTARK